MRLLAGGSGAGGTRIADPTGREVAVSEIETLNKFIVCSQGNDVMVMRFQPKMSADDAMLLAAYLVSIAESCNPSHSFEEVLKAVQNT